VSVKPKIAVNTNTIHPATYMTSVNALDYLECFLSGTFICLWTTIIKEQKSMDAIIQMIVFDLYPGISQLVSIQKSFIAKHVIFGSKWEAIVWIEQFIFQLIPHCLISSLCTWLLLIRVWIPGRVFLFPGIRNPETSFPGFPGAREWRLLQYC